MEKLENEINDFKNKPIPVRVVEEENGSFSAYTESGWSPFVNAPSMEEVKKKFEEAHYAGFLMRLNLVFDSEIERARKELKKRYRTNRDSSPQEESGFIYS